MKFGLGVRTQFPEPDAGPPRCAQLMGFASRGCLVIVLGATAERRNLFFRSDLGLPWIRFFSLRLSREATGVGSSVRRASRRPSPIPVSATDIDEQIEARLAPFHWKAIRDTRVLIAEDLGAAPTPWCSRRWSAKPEGAQPADTRRDG